jgi:hypothetical protein
VVGRNKRGGVKRDVPLLEGAEKIGVSIKFSSGTRGVRAWLSSSRVKQQPLSLDVGAILTPKPHRFSNLEAC